MYSAQAWPVFKPWQFAMTRYNALPNWASQTNWRAGHCEFVFIPNDDLIKVDIHEINHVWTADVTNENEECDPCSGPQSVGV